MRLKVAIWIGCLILSNIAMTTAQSEDEVIAEAIQEQIKLEDTPRGGRAEEDALIAEEEIDTIEETPAEEEVVGATEATPVEEPAAPVEPAAAPAEEAPVEETSVEEPAAPVEPAAAPAEEEIDTTEETPAEEEVVGATEATPVEEPALDAPVGSSKRYTISSLVDGMTMALDFEQQANNTLKMHCRITTQTSSIATMEKFCMDTEKPKIYMMEAGTDCSDLSSLTEVQARNIAHTLSPNDDVYEQVKGFKWSDLDGVCFAMLQKKASGRAEGSTIDESIKGCDVLTETETATETETETATESETQTAEDIIDNAAVVIEDIEARIGARRSGRLIMTSYPLTRTGLFNTITLSGFTILSFGTVFVAPRIVNAAPSPGVVSFGSFGGYTYNPWATLPYLQLPGWTTTTVYAIVLGLFGLYGIVLLGSYIPGVSDFMDTISTVVGESSATRRFSRFVTYSNNKLFDGLTNLVHNSINRFARRNTYQRPYKPVHHTRRTDLDYNYYDYTEDQRYEENQYFRK